MGEFEPGYAGPSIIAAILIAWAVIMVAGASEAMTEHQPSAAHIQYTSEVR